MCTITNTRQRRSGGAAIEFAIILPLLAGLVLGCVDLGRFAYSYIAITNAARAGAGFGIVHPFDAYTQPIWEARIRQAVADEMRALPDFDPNAVTITPGTDSEGFWTVTVDVPYSFRTVVPYPWMPPSQGATGHSTFNMHRTVIMRGIRS